MLRRNNNRKQKQTQHNRKQKIQRKGEQNTKIPNIQNTTKTKIQEYKKAEHVNKTKQKYEMTFNAEQHKYQQ